MALESKRLRRRSARILGVMASLTAGAMAAAGCNAVIGLGDLKDRPADAGPTTTDDGSVSDGPVGTGDGAGPVGDSSGPVGDGAVHNDSGPVGDGAGPVGDGGGPIGDSGSSSDTGSVDSGVDAGIAISAADKTVFIATTASLDASGTTAVIGTPVFTWTLTSAPTGTTVTTATLAGASTAKPSFVPDVAGDYALRLSVSADGNTATKTVTVHAVAPEVLYLQGNSVPASDGGTSFLENYIVATSDGLKSHAFNCPFAAAEGVITTGTATGAGDFTDFWEAPPGQASRFAVVTIAPADDSGLTPIWIGAADASCTAPPVTVTHQLDAAAIEAEQPRFNADGTRIAFYSVTDTSIATVSADGTGLRVLAAYMAGSAQTLVIDQDPVGSTSSNVPPRPQWTGTSVAWARNVSASAWEIVTAPDTANAGTPTQYMTCSGITPREFQFLADGTVIASYRATTTGPENLFHLGRVGASTACNVITQYTNLSASIASQATDFSVSPDGLTIVYLQVDGATDDSGFTSHSGGEPYIVPVAGGAPTRVSADFMMYGPRWIGGGSRLLMSRYTGVNDGGGIVPYQSAVIVRPAEAGPLPTVLAHADGITSFVAAGGNGGCSMGAGTAPSAAGFFGIAIAGIARILRRRRRS